MEHGQQRLGYNIDIPIIAVDTFGNACSAGLNGSK